MKDLNMARFPKGPIIAGGTLHVVEESMPRAQFP